MPTFTFENRKPEAGALAPDGIHDVFVVDFDFRLSSNQNDMVELKLRVPGYGPFYDNLVFTEAAAWRIDQFLVAIGKAPAVGESIEINEDLLKGAKAKAKIGHEEYTHNEKKRTKNVVVEWLPSEISKAEPEKDQFD